MKPSAPRSDLNTHELPYEYTATFGESAVRSRSSLTFIALSPVNPRYIHSIGGRDLSTPGAPLTLAIKYCHT